MTAKRVLTMVCAIAIMVFSNGASVLAQDATPAQDANPMVECVAPDLPPGTPTPMEEEGSPVAEEASPEAIEGEATPADEMAGHEMEVTETPADEATATAARGGLDGILDCIAAGDFLGLAGLMTANGWAFVTETGNPYDVPLSMEGAAPVRIVTEGDVVSDENGRVGLHLVYGDLFNGPGVLSSERWYLVEEDGYWKFDGIANAPAPDDFMPDATVVSVDTVDFAFALSQNEIPAGPAIFRLTNTSYTHSPHVGVVVTLVEGLTAEQVIQMDALPEEQLTGFFVATFLEPGQSADLIFENIEPGVYTLVCDFTTAEGVEHWKLGMVAQFDVV